MMIALFTKRNDIYFVIIFKICVLITFYYMGSVYKFEFTRIFAICIDTRGGINAS